MIVKPDPKWSNPRNTIACKYRKNDFGYVTHGSLAALQVLKLFDLAPSALKDLTVLDYGCGTGREARIMSAVFKQVIAYDPTANCIQEFRKEIAQCEREFPNIFMYTDIEKAPECDFGYSLHVMEHLNEIDARIMMEWLRKKVRKTLMLSYAKRNCPVVASYLTAEQIEQDKIRNQNPDRGVRWRIIHFKEHE